MAAAKGGYSELAKLLLFNGADVNAKDDRGRTALMWAIESGHDEMAEILRKYGSR